MATPNQFVPTLIIIAGILAVYAVPLSEMTHHWALAAVFALSVAVGIGFARVAPGMTPGGGDYDLRSEGFVCALLLAFDPIWSRFGLLLLFVSFVAAGIWHTNPGEDSRIRRGLYRALPWGALGVAYLATLVRPYVHEWPMGVDWLVVAAVLIAALVLRMRHESAGELSPPFGIEWRFRSIYRVVMVAGTAGAAFIAVAIGTVDYLLALLVAMALIVHSLSWASKRSAEQG